MRSETKAYRPISWPMQGAGGDTGSWRSHRPVIDHGLCTHCQFCWIFCPEATVSRAAKDEEIVIDYRYCKGCGVCAHECPAGAIRMEKEEGA